MDPNPCGRRPSARSPRIAAQAVEAAGRGPATGNVTLCGLEAGVVSVDFSVFFDAPNFQWQIETAPDVWEDLTFGTFNLPCGGELIVIDPYAAAIDITVLACPGGNQFRLRCQLTSGCRNATSEPAMVKA